MLPLKKRFSDEQIALKLSQAGEKSKMRCVLTVLWAASCTGSLRESMHDRMIITTDFS